VSDSKGRFTTAYECSMRFFLLLANFQPAIRIACHGRTAIMPLLARFCCISEIRDEGRNLVLNNGRSNDGYSEM
jgi:hypothetical protein